jgi:hypothetical protein
MYWALSGDRATLVISGACSFTGKAAVIWFELWPALSTSQISTVHSFSSPVGTAISVDSVPDTASANAATDIGRLDPPVVIGNLRRYLDAAVALHMQRAVRRKLQT